MSKGNAVIESIHFTLVEKGDKHEWQGHRYGVTLRANDDGTWDVTLDPHMLQETVRLDLKSLDGAIEKIAGIKKFVERVSAILGGTE